jgi:hypothetical protein
MKSTTVTKYGLRIISKDRLAGLYIVERGSADYAAGYGTHQASLSDYDSDGVFLVDKKIDAERVLGYNTPWYNSNSKSPGWGTIDPKDLEVVEVEIVTTIKSTTFNRSPQIRFKYVGDYRDDSGKYVPDHIVVYSFEHPDHIVNLIGSRAMLNESFIEIRNLIPFEETERDRELLKTLTEESDTGSVSRFVARRVR